MAARPPGFLEHAAALGPTASTAGGSAKKATALDAGGTILMHAGLDPATAAASIDASTALVRDQIRLYDRARRYLVDRELILPFFTFPRALAAVVAEAEALQAGRRDNVDARHIEMLQVILGAVNSPLLAATRASVVPRLRDLARGGRGRAGRRCSPATARSGSSRATPCRRTSPAGSVTACSSSTPGCSAVYKGRAVRARDRRRDMSAVYTDGREVLQEAGAQRTGAPER
jgi:hypothetical protein